MDQNPTPIYTLHSSGQVALAAFLGGPLGGCILMAQNYRRVGSEQSARAAVGYGALSTVALVIVAFMLPGNFPRSVLPVAYTLSLRHVAELLQGKTLSDHLKSSGRRSSWWMACGVGCLSLVVTIGLFLLGAMVLPERLVSK